ncbi:hypothetical protein BD779DRAFT_1408299, partial [Infundibulicybe gibba]
IPAGMTATENIWPIGRVFKDPKTSNPAMARCGRELHEDMQVFTFGFGWQVCPGQHMATALVFSNTALQFSAFKISADLTVPVNLLESTESTNTH